MDRRRRRRVLAVLPKELSDLIVQDDGHVPFTRAIVSKVGFRRPSAARVVKCLKAIDTNVVKVVDLVVAAALESVWAGQTEK